MGRRMEEEKMSNTPRTDAAMVRMERLDGDIDEVVSADFAKRLESENADLRHDIERLTASLTAEVNKAPSATAAPVAWMWDQADYGETDVRGRGWHLVMGKQAPTDHWMIRNLVPLYAAHAPRVEETAKSSCIRVVPI